MERTHTDILKGLVSAGKRWRYGENPDDLVSRRIVWELKHIIDAGFADYYVMAFWIFKYSKQGIIFWARGAMPSSIVCYCLGLTEVDPIKYGLHSARFVKEDLPKFQFDIESSRFDEFMKKAEEILAENAEDYDISAIRECLFKDLKPSSYLSKKKERPIPKNVEDEFALYALRYPDTMKSFDNYILRKNGEAWAKTGITKLNKILAPTYGLLVYQEQMVDILRGIFHTGGIEANHIRLAIQRGEAEKVEAYKKKLFADLKDITDGNAEVVWQHLTSNPHAFLKAHAVSQVLQSYKYMVRSPSEWRSVQHRIELLTRNKDGEFYPTMNNETGLWGFTDRHGEMIIPCQWKGAHFSSEGLAGVQGTDGKWGFIDITGKVVIPLVWKYVQWFENGEVVVNKDFRSFLSIDRNGNEVH